jgi:CubicO group peptidase (beta-lactamase class C family)
VDSSRRATPVQYVATTLTPWNGIISTARDLVQFDLSIKNDLLVTAESLAAAWRAPLSPTGQRLPHGLGWFVQIYNGEPVIWQYGMGDPGSSSMIVILPTRSITLILLANSNGLVKSFNLSAGDVNTSPFGRLFLGAFIR